MRVRAGFITGLAALAFAAPAHADTWTVTNGSSDATSPVCNSDQHTCVSLRTALAASEATKEVADVINVPAGTININNDLLIQSDITVNGVSARSNIIDGGAKYRGFRVSSTGAAKINHFTIRDGAGGQGGTPDGGGILNASGVVQLTYVRVTASRAGDGGSGGGVANVEGTMTMAHSLIDNNTAANGAGVANLGGAETPDRGLFGAVDSTIFKNTAGSGGTGGIDSRGGAANLVILNRSTVADNVGGVRAVGGLQILSGAAQVLTSVFARNLAEGTTLNCGTVKPTSSTNNVEDNKDCGFDLDSVNPGLATALSSAGGELDVLALTAASPAVDHAPLSACSAAGTSDQRDMERPQGPGCDSGAYELDQAPTMTINSGPSGTINVRNASFTFSTTEPGVTVQCRLSGPGQSGTFSICTSATAQSYASLADGNYTFSVRALDGTFANPPIASQVFVVDATLDTAITNGPIGPTTDPTPTYTFTGSGGAAGFQCRVDSAAFAGCTSPFTTAMLSDGPHTFEVRALSASGAPDPTPATRSITVDTVAPNTMIDTGPNGSVNSTSATFAFSSNEGSVSFQCALDGAAFATCPAGYTGLSQGSHTFQVRATDAAGNTDGTPASRTWIVDTTAPDTMIDTGPNGTVGSASATFAFSSTETGSSFQCALDGAAFATCPAGYTGLSQGSHTFQVRATDTAGNTDTTPASRTWTVDTVAPNTLIDTGPNGSVNSASATFTFSSTETGSSFQCALDGAAFATCPAGYTGLSQGSHTFQVRATDTAGNTDTTPASRTWTVDTVAPDTMIDTGPNGSVSSASASFTFSSTETGSSFQCALDGAAFATCPAGYTGLSQGSHTFQVRATDAAGNTDTTPASRTWTVDTVAPNTMIDTGPNGSVNSASASFTVSSTETGSSFQCALDGAAFATCPAGYTGLSQGSHTFQVRATDTAGNTDTTPASRTWTVDTVAPNTMIDTGPNGSVNSASATFTFSSTETGGSFQCALDGAAFATCPAGYTGLSQGSHTFQVRATDAAGNTDTTPASRTWTVDTVAPNTTIDTGPNGSVSSASASFTFSSTETGSSFQCALDGAAFATCPAGYTGLSQGSHTFQVRATDIAGNTDTTPASRTWTVDTVAPNTMIDTGPNGSVSSASASFTFSSTETGSSFQCALDGAAFATCPAGYTGLSQGSHTFQVRATDAAGNTDTTAATRTWTVDTIAPDTALTPIITPTNDNTPTFAFSSEAGATFQCRVDTAAFASCTSPRTTAPLSDGSHTFEVRASDAAGNTDTTPAQQSFMIDTGAPNTTIDSGPPALTNVATPTFTFSSDETGSTFECRVDAAPFATCTSPRTTAALADGAHTFDVRATDSFGNLDLTAASSAFTVDTTPPPAPAVVSGPQGVTTNSAPAFEFSTPDATSVTCKLDGPGGAGTFGSCTSPKSFASLAPGDYVFFVRSIDAAGNQETTQRAFTVTSVQGGQPTPTPTPTPTVTPAPTPVPGESVGMKPVGGKVLVKLPGSNKFVPLDPSVIKNGAEVDTRNGVVEITRSDGGTAKFYDGIFKLSQSGGITTLTLTEKLTGCPAKKSKASAAAKKPKTRKLWGDGKGKFRTRGQFSAATVRGTKWLVQDTCTTTLTRVTEGVVAVEDFAKKKTVLVKKGKRYTAFPKKR